MDMKGHIKKMFLTGNLKYIALNEIKANPGVTPYKTLKRIRDKGVRLDAGSFYNSVKSLASRRLVEKRAGKRTRSINLYITDDGKTFLKEYKKLFTIVQDRVRGRKKS